ncbi:DUF3566 domain-containing protein [Falsarthrobacter nasiphocae]|uniref:DUF3566 domain-containing protein n=1 Tax=Falsarthrobacter nasiphocae TaxID=189863 RepID=A0AAE3YHX1_9MICC|nr:hypothetical protein [Falsarthrobacter nasiphocae]
MSESQTGRAGAPRTGNRPQAGRPVQRPSQRTAPARAGQRQGLVRPAPKAKTRKARLVVSRLDPWSVLKLAFLLSVALGIVAVVASIVLWVVLDLTGIFDRVNTLLGDIGGSSVSSFDIRQIASMRQVVSFTTILSLVNIVLITALSMLAAVLYNICASLVGGVGVTLTDD